MKKISVEIYGPRLKLFESPKEPNVVLLLDEYDEAHDESKIVRITMPRAQLEEWVKTFQAALR